MMAIHSQFTSLFHLPSTAIKRDTVCLSLYLSVSVSLCLTSARGPVYPKLLKWNHLTMTSNMKYNLLSELNSQTDAWTIKVRIIRMWDAVNSKNGQLMSLQLILLDEENNDIHASIWHNMAPKFRADIEEGKIYYISNMRVGSCNDTYRPIPTEKKLFFRFNTDVKEVKEIPPTFPAQKFHFLDYAILAERVNDIVQLSDIIGKVIAIGPIQISQSDRGDVKRRNVELLTFKSLQVRLTLWNDAANEIEDNAFDEIEQPVVIVVTAMTVRQFQGNYTLSTTTASKVYVNLEIPEAEEFLDSDIYGRQILKLPSQQSSQLSIEQQIQHNRKTIEELKAMQWESGEQDTIITCKATVENIEAQSGWYYISCELCPRKLQPKDDTLWCDICKMVSQYPIQRYRLQLQVKDSTGSTSFVLFDREAQKLIGKPARELANQEEKNNTATFPSTLNNIIQNTYIFQLRLNDLNLKEGWQNYTVNKVFDINYNPVQHDSMYIRKETESQPNSITGSSSSAANQKKRVGNHLEEEESNEEIATAKATPPPYASKKRTNTKKSN